VDADHAGGAAASKSFYDAHSSRFVFHYGKVIQQCRAAPSNDTEEVRLMAAAAQLAVGQRILDNGCGVGGVMAELIALYGRTTAIDGVTISDTEAQATRQRIAPLCPNCTVYRRDYSTALPAEQVGRYAAIVRFFVLKRSHTHTSRSRSLGRYARVLFLDTTGYVHGPCDGMSVDGLRTAPSCTTAALKFA